MESAPARVWEGVIHITWLRSNCVHGEAQHETLMSVHEYKLREAVTYAVFRNEPVPTGTSDQKVEANLENCSTSTGRSDAAESAETMAYSSTGGPHGAIDDHWWRGCW
jgi:hypothetical protein